MFLLEKLFHADADFLAALPYEFDISLVLLLLIEHFFGLHPIMFFHGLSGLSIRWPERSVHTLA